MTNATVSDSEVSFTAEQRRSYSADHRPGMRAGMPTCRPRKKLVCTEMARPTRFERVTLAFGGKSRVCTHPDLAIVGYETPYASIDRQQCEEWHAKFVQSSSVPRPAMCVGNCHFPFSLATAHEADAVDADVIAQEVDERAHTGGQGTALA